MYVSTAWSMVKAYDAATGKLLWSYDPEVPRELGVKGCCDVVNRGVAAWKGKIYVGTFDGRLVALDAQTGKPVWSVVTVDQSKPFTITQAPRVVKGRVMIGMSGGEYGVRGYISAYDARDRQARLALLHRAGRSVEAVRERGHGDGREDLERRVVEARRRRHGVGRHFLRSRAQPRLLRRRATASRGARNYRSASKGDNLFLSSIVALNADTGAYVWHYQATPGEEWDFDAVQQLILADLTIDGTQRKVMMQANKNGFFYVLDRKTGKLISAKTLRADQLGERHRPEDRPPDRESRHPLRRDRQSRFGMMPGPLGAHSWQPMAFNPKTGLVYIPAQEIGNEFTPVDGLQAVAGGLEPWRRQARATPGARRAICSPGTR